MRYTGRALLSGKKRGERGKQSRQFRQHQTLTLTHQVSRSGYYKYHHRRLRSQDTLQNINDGLQLPSDDQSGVCNKESRYFLTEAREYASITAHISTKQES